MRYVLALVGVIVVGWVAIALVSCEPGVKSGVVIERKHEDANTYLTFIPICTTSGGKYPVTTCTPTPYYIHDDEDFRLKLRNPEGKTGWVRVSREDYETFVEGTSFGGDTVAENNQKRRKA